MQQYCPHNVYNRNSFFNITTQSHLLQSPHDQSERVKHLPATVVPTVTHQSLQIPADVSPLHLSLQLCNWKVLNPNLGAYTCHSPLDQLQFVIEFDQYILPLCRPMVNVVV